MIHIKSITKHYAKTIALSEVSFEMNPGEIVGLIGLNGAGKTTLIRVISGLCKLYRGEVHFDFNKSATPRLVSVLSAEQGLYKSLTSEMMINYFGRLQNPAFHISDINHLIKQLNIQPVIDKKIEHLSSGWRQKILVLLTFMNDPQIILLDEPSNYLDFLGQQQLEELINTEKTKGKYIIYATHNLHSLETKCDKVIFLHDGKLLQQFLPPFDNIYKTVFTLVNRE
jgi:ABC-type multidrug transport system ATPase subunit